LSQYYILGLLVLLVLKIVSKKILFETMFNLQGQYRVLLP
jgi:hypothetical protein